MSPVWFVSDVPGLDPTATATATDSATDSATATDSERQRAQFPCPHLLGAGPITKLSEPPGLKSA